MGLPLQLRDLICISYIEEDRKNSAADSSVHKEEICPPYWIS